MQGAVLVVEQAHSSAMEAVRALEASQTELDQLIAGLGKVRAEANPYKGPLDM